MSFLMPLLVFVQEFSGCMVLGAVGDPTGYNCIFTPSVGAVSMFVETHQGFVNRFLKGLGLFCNNSPRIDDAGVVRGRHIHRSVVGARCAR